MARLRRFASFACALLVCFVANPTVAGPLQPVIFAIDPASTISVSIPSYGTTGQGSGGEGETANVLGHFLVTFDPTDGTPDTIQFELGHGFIDAQPSGLWLPGPGGSGTPSPADIGIQTGPFTIAVRDLVWDWGSGPVANNGDNTYNANATGFQVLSMTSETSFSGAYDSTGYSNNLSNGFWSLSNAGDEWTLSLSGHYLDTSLLGGIVVDFAPTIQATATFSAANIDIVIPDVGGNATAESLGGAGGQPGGVSVAFSGVTANANFSAQQLPDTLAFSLEAIQALQNNDALILSSSDPNIGAQFWEVSLTDDSGAEVNFGSALMQIQYDDSSFTPGFNEQSLGIWHYNSDLGDWESFSVGDGNATVNAATNTITFELTNFSELQLGVFVVPETSTFVLMSLCSVGLVLVAARRRLPGMVP